MRRPCGATSAGAAATSVPTFGTVIVCGVTGGSGVNACVAKCRILAHAVFKNREVGLREVRDRLALAIDDAHVHGDEQRLGLKGRLGLGGGRVLREQGAGEDAGDEQ